MISGLAPSRFAISFVDDPPISMPRLPIPRGQLRNHQADLGRQAVELVSLPVLLERSLHRNQKLHIGEWLFEEVDCPLCIARTASGTSP